MPVKGTIDVDEQLCKGCELCVADCPQHVLALAWSTSPPRVITPPTFSPKAAPAARSARWSAPKRPSRSTVKAQK